MKFTLVVVLATGFLTCGCGGSLVKRTWALDSNSTSPIFLGISDGAKGREEDMQPHPLDYNRETRILKGLPVTFETIFACLFVTLVGSVPLLLAKLIGGDGLTKAHKIESACLVIWLVSAIFGFCNILQFNSLHWTGPRSLTIVEAVYLLSQILTTVGYGDITPAFPKSQVWVAVNVILALCLYGSIIMECTSRFAESLAKEVEDRAQALAAAEEAAHPEAAAEVATSPVKDWLHEPDVVDEMPVVKSGCVFLVFAIIGVFFWHLYPGEEKTWLQAVYMSVITLSTVGFGFFNATTEGGKVFGAFWMLFGVAALAATICSFVDLMTLVKAKERRNGSHEKLEFYRILKRLAHAPPTGVDQGMDSYDFMKFALLLSGVVNDDEVKKIEDRFALLAGAGDKLTLDTVLRSEAPPVAFAEEAARRALEK
mmetsp:Transcript_165189/g.530151  ORF Transcript_165189/g.530151 Transcript_165189/m.530151 type:complete len:426 (-) Transcript_165189:108-1385(-)